MNIKEYIESLTNGKADDLSVKRVERILKLLGNPQDSINYIHVAGTNGKGSVIEMLNSVFIKSNLKVGKFISPHLCCYNERISINGKNIKDKQIKKIYDKIKPIIAEENMTISYFEFFTLIALLYFYEEKVDIAVIETGLGGLYDSTNIIHPLISVITTIGYDHTHILGNTLEKIALQKAGIIKEKSSVVYTKQAPNINKIIINTCNNKKATLHMVEKCQIKDIKVIQEKETFSYKDYNNIKINLKGKKQIENACLVLECCDILKEKGYQITTDAIREGLESVIHPARFELICSNPQIIFDGGHNEQAIKNLKSTIDTYYKNNPKIYVITLLKTKDYKKVLNNIMTEEAIYILTDGNDKTRYTDTHIMYKYAQSLNQNYQIFEMNLKQAINFCKKNPKHVSFIIGSFYIYKDVKAMIEKRV